MNIGERILALMQAQNLSYRQLQDLTGISRSTLNRYAQGKPIPMDKLEKIASALGEKPEILMGWAERTKRDVVREKLEKLSEADLDRLEAIIDAWIGG